MPSPFKSTQTRSPIEANSYSPASHVKSTWPLASVIGTVVPSNGLASLSRSTGTPAAFCVVIVSPTGATNVSSYVPGGKSLNRYRPSESVRVTSTTGLPAPSVPDKMTVTPSTPGSPASWMPSPFRSTQTRSPIVIGWYKPAST
jgi:hypothetical protein